MDALTDKNFISVPIYGSYTEQWSADYRLTVQYSGQHFARAVFDGKWHCPDAASPHEELYIRSYAFFHQIADDENMVYIIQEELKHTRLLPQELLRILLDEKGMNFDLACGIVLASFGRLILDSSFSEEIQPRAFALTEYLAKHLKTQGCAIHDAYDSSCRLPLGSIECGDSVKLSLFSFGGVVSAKLIVWGDGFSEEIDMLRTGDEFYTEFTAPDFPCALSYKFSLDTCTGEKWLCPGRDGHNGCCGSNDGVGFRLTVFEKGFVTPEWFKNGIMYQIFPDRFGPFDSAAAVRGIEYHRGLGQTPELHGSASEPVRWQARSFEKDYSPDDFYGGTLNGICAQLDYLKELGVSIIYLNPIVEAKSNHRYDTADYSRVDPILGTNEDYKALCKKADLLGIRIINDGVFSHTGADSLYFNRYGNYDSCGACQGNQSPYYPWYSFEDFPGKYKSWWGFEDLPEVHELNRSWQSFVISGKNSIVKQWLKMGASGWRIDVADELPDEVLALIRKAAKSVKPDAVIIGEVWEDAVSKVSYGHHRKYALGNALDSVMNYPLRDAILSFARGKSSAYELRDFLLNQKYNYPAPMYLSLMNLLGSHDVERLHTALAYDFEIKSLDRSRQLKLEMTPKMSLQAQKLQKICAAIQYMLPGVPCLYYGDEECLDGGADPFNRAPFIPACAGLHNYYAKLAEIRNTYSELRGGDMSIEVYGKNVFNIIRGKICCIINNSDEPFSVAFNAVALLDGIDSSIVDAHSAQIYKFT